MRSQIIDAGVHGAPSWVDLSTPDVAGSERFYTGLFGWSTATTTGPMGAYTIGSVGSFEVAGMMAHPADMEGRPALWTVFFTVNDAEATLATIDSVEGTIAQEAFEIPGGAHVGVALDPAGAVFAVVSGGPRPTGEYLRSAPGSVAWVELLTREPATMMSFYEQVFHWSPVTDPATHYVTWHSDGAVAGGMMAMPSEVPVEAPAHWAVYFAVSDCQAIQHRCEQLGGRVLHPATAVGEMCFAVLADPQGATFHVLQGAV